MALLLACGEDPGAEGDAGRGTQVDAGPVPDGGEDAGPDLDSGGGSVVDAGLDGGPPDDSCTWVDPSLPVQTGFTTFMHAGAEALGPDFAAKDLDSFRRTLDDLEGRVDWLRIHLITWNLVRPELGDDEGLVWNEANVAEYRTALQEAKERGFRVYAMYVFDERHHSSTINAAGEGALNDEDRRLWRQWNEGLRDRFGDSVDMWQPLIESSWTDFSGWSGRFFDPAVLKINRPSDDYFATVGELLAISRDVLGPGACITSNSGGWPRGTETEREEQFATLRAFYDAIEPSVDVISLSAFLDEPAQHATFADDLAALSERYGRLWIAATGFSSRFPDNPTRSSVERQRDSVVAILDSVAPEDVGGVLVFNYQDHQPQRSSVHGFFGVDGFNHEPKASRPAVLEALRRLRDPAAPRALLRFNHMGTPFDHRTTTGGFAFPGFSVPQDDLYDFNFILGWLPQTPVPGTVPVYECVHESPTDHFLSLDEDCEGDVSLGVAGHLWTEASGDVVPLRACRFELPQVNHFYIRGDACRSGADEGVLGYILPGAQLPR